MPAGQRNPHSPVDGESGVALASESAGAIFSPCRMSKKGWGPNSTRHLCLLIRFLTISLLNEGILRSPILIPNHLLSTHGYLKLNSCTLSSREVINKVKKHGFA